MTRVGLPPGVLSTTTPREEPKSVEEPESVNSVETFESVEVVLLLLVTPVSFIWRGSESEPVEFVTFQLT